MIGYARFQYGAAPSCGTHWTMQAFAIAGLGERPHTGAHHPPNAGPTAHCPMLITTVRHPADWLYSYYYGRLSGYTGLEKVDRLMHIARSLNFKNFLSSYCRLYAGTISEVFADYNATVAWRLEDYPWPVIEFLQAQGASKIAIDHIKKLPASNVSRIQANPLTEKQRAMIRDAESGLCEQYEYYM